MSDIKIPKRRMRWFGASILLAIAGGIDITQALLDALVIGVLLNRVIDFFVGIFFIIVFAFKRILNTRIAIMLGLSFVAEFIPVIDFLPFWTGDILYTIYRIRKEDKWQIKEALDAIEQEKQNEVFVAQANQQARIDAENRYAEALEAQDYQQQEQKLDVVS